MTAPDPDLAAPLAESLRRAERKRLYQNGYDDGVKAERHRIVTGDPDTAEIAARAEAWRIWAEDDNDSPDVDVFHAGWDCASAYFDARVAEAREAERQRIAVVISPEQFRKLADWFDADDEFKEAMFPETWSPGSRKDEVQQDLRAVADLLDGAS